MCIFQKFWHSDLGKKWTILFAGASGNLNRIKKRASELQKDSDARRRKPAFLAGGHGMLAYPA